MRGIHVAAVMARRAPADDDTAGRWDILQETPREFKIFDCAAGLYVVGTWRSLTAAHKRAKRLAAAFDAKHKGRKQA